MNAHQRRLRRRRSARAIARAERLCPEEFGRLFELHMQHMEREALAFIRVPRGWRIEQFGDTTVAYCDEPITHQQLFTLAVA